MPDSDRLRDCVAKSCRPQTSCELGACQVQVPSSTRNAMQPRCLAASRLYKAKAYRVSNTASYRQVLTTVVYIWLAS